MDEDIDHAELYAEPARKRIKVNHLMNVFDQVHVEIGAKAILSKQLAKGALARISNEKVGTSNTRCRSSQHSFDECCEKCS